MTKLSILLVDDERLARQELRTMLADVVNVSIVGEARDADEAEKIIEALQPDAMLLDIQMPERTGFDLLESLQHPPNVIFTTAYDQYAIKAFEANALDYLLKPIRKSRLLQAIDKLERKVAGNRREEGASGGFLDMNKQVFIRDGEKCRFITVGDIWLIESIGNYARLYFGNETIMIKRSLNVLADQLDPEKFLRANRQALFNVGFVTDVSPAASARLRVTLNGHKQLELSSRQSRHLKSKMSF